MIAHAQAVLIMSPRCVSQFELNDLADNINQGERSAGWCSGAVDGDSIRSYNVREACVTRHRYIMCPALLMLSWAPALGATPTSAKPAGNPGDWITSDDYPPAALRDSEKGVTAFRMNIDASGHVAGCSITKSSGHALLDETTCTLLKARAAFVAATDKRGQSIAGTYLSAVRWEIPAGEGGSKISMISCAMGEPEEIRVTTPQGCAR